jgi:hypothetical protein
MAALGTVAPLDPTVVVRPVLVPLANYQVVRGHHIGPVTVYDPKARFTPALVTPVNGYVVRQLRVIFKQIWPNHGQRFPQ